MGSQEDIFFFIGSFFDEITIARPPCNMIFWKIKQIKRLKFSNNLRTHHILKSGKKVRFHNALHDHMHRIPSHLCQIGHIIHPDDSRQICPLRTTQIRIPQSLLHVFDPVLIIIIHKNEVLENKLKRVPVLLKNSFLSLKFFKNKEQPFSEAMES